MSLTTVWVIFFPTPALQMPTTSLGHKEILLFLDILKTPQESGRSAFTCKRPGYGVSKLIKPE